MKERGEEEDMPLDNPRVGAPRSCIKIPAIKLVRLHMFDWMVLAFLIAMEVLLNWIEPFHRFVGDGMMETLRYPLKANTVPVWAVGVLAILGPMIIITGMYIKKRNEYDLHHAMLGLLFSVLITGVLTDAIKDGVGRPRPNFYWRCFPNGIPSFKNVTGEVLCHGDEAVVKEGYKSFPSGHSSWSFAGLGFLSWYLAGKIRAFDRQGHVAKLCIVLLPLLLAALVAISRVSDYWHHWQDVCTGGILGAVVATLCYLHFFPSPAGEEGRWPHAYFCNFLNQETHYQMHSTTTSNDDESRQRPSREHVEVEIRSNS